MEHIIALPDPGPGISANKGGEIEKNMKKHGIKPAEALFSDDSSGNIKTAKGMCHAYDLGEGRAYDWGRGLAYDEGGCQLEGACLRLRRGRAKFEITVMSLILSKITLVPATVFMKLRYFVSVR